MTEIISKRLSTLQDEHRIICEKICENRAILHFFRIVDELKACENDIRNGKNIVLVSGPVNSINNYIFGYLRKYFNLAMTTKKMLFSNSKDFEEYHLSDDVIYDKGYIREDIDDIVDVQRSNVWLGKEFYCITDTPYQFSDDESKLSKFIFFDKDKMPGVYKYELFHYNGSWTDIYECRSVTLSTIPSDIDLTITSDDIYHDMFDNIFDPVKTGFCEGRNVCGYPVFKCPWCGFLNPVSTVKKGQIIMCNSWSCPKRFKLG